MEFKYKTLVGKTVGHKTFISNKNQLQEILDRYDVDPHFLFDIKVNGKDIKVESIVRKLAS